MIVARPAPGERLVLERGRLDAAHGLVGDSWAVRKRPTLDSQLTAGTVAVGDEVRKETTVATGIGRSST